MRILIILLSSIVLAACNGVKDTPLPRDLEKMGTIKSAIEKLNPEERELVTGYIMRHTIGATLGNLFGKNDVQGIPEGMTIGKAIDEQRNFKENVAIEKSKQQALKEKLKAEGEAAQKKIREAVNFTFISKRLVKEDNYSGFLINEKLEVVFGYQNKTDKEISGVKGTAIIKDIFGEKISAFNISNDESIPAGKSITWIGSRSLMSSLGDNNDRKFSELEKDKFTVDWEPEMIVFSDGTKITVPKE